ncbi:MAG TPA: hypothetical protein VKE69_13055, partial [Planctomycetota bacterium]|nr:hypothetical protein [Planctomycetota bacterium]
FVDRFIAATRASGFRMTTHCDVSGGAFLMTQRVLERLRVSKDELIARYEPSKPTIRKDVEDMLYWGGQELGAFEHSLLSYRLFVLDR